MVIPTFREADNVLPLLERLETALSDCAWEAIFVDDDSDDGTAALLRDIARRDRRVRVLQRLGRRGLSSAVTEGFLASSAPFLAVMDADLQHDETLLPAMLHALKTEPLDIVVASRYAADGGTGAWSRRRVALSGLGGKLAHLVVPRGLTDPMSGFFMLTRAAFERAARRLSIHGFKILLDLFASTPEPYRFRELPYVFRPRAHGASKLDSAVMLDFLVLLADKAIGRIVPVRFVLFALVGALGILVHLATLWLALHVMPFAAAQILASVVAMSSNFALNNLVTYRDRRLRGWRLLGGLLSFYAVCSLGALANIGIAEAAFRGQYGWWLSGLAGAVIGVVWNFSASATLTWRTR